MSSYAQTFRELNVTVPTGSRSTAGIYGGSGCPDSISFGRGHGTAPMTGTIRITGRYPMQYGRKLTLRIGSTLFTGIVVYVHNHNDMQEGRTTEIRLVDMRDRLHDVHLYGQFNMIDQSNGMYYHLLPINWQNQVKTIVRKVEPQDFDKMEEKPEIEFACELGLISAATLFNEIAKSFKFTWTASKMAIKVMKFSRPDNLDWNSGIKVIDAMQSILDKNGLQMTFWGDLHCHVTMKGWSDNPMLQEMMATNLCLIKNCIGENRGGELNERGRRVAIVGERNKYQNYFAATPNWNKKFTLPVILGWELAALLESKKLTLRSKLKELPKEWHDPEKWNDKPRNDMTIEEYIQEICFKVYVVDTEYPIKDIHKTMASVLAPPPEEDEEEPKKVNGLPKSKKEEDDKEKMSGFITLPGMREEVTIKGKKTTRKMVEYEGYEDYREWIPTNDPFLPAYNSYFPVSDKLVSDSQAQFVAYASYKNIRVKGYRDPFDFDPATVVPIIDGVSLDVETVIDKDNCYERYRVRLIFSEMKYILLVDPEDDEHKDIPLHQIKSDIQYHGPDFIAVQLSLDKELFTYKAGEVEDAPRVREQLHNVTGLRRNFIDDKEVSLLSVFMQDQDVNQLVNAKDIAKRIAQQVLFHEYITTSGGMTMDKQCGFQCDGLIDTVNTNYSGEGGVEEQLTFTALINEIAEPFIIDLSLDSKLKDVKALVADSLQKKRIDIAKAHKVAKQAAGNKDNREGRLAGHRSWDQRNNVFGDEQRVVAKLTKSHVDEQGEFYEGEGMLAGNPSLHAIWHDDNKEGKTSEDMQVALPPWQLQKYS